METISQSPSTLSDKPGTISERLAEAAKSSFVGRKKELSLLSNAIEADDPPFFVAYVHGPGGIGKSRLIHAAIERLSPKINRYVMDCREIEPTPLGFQIALGAALEVPESEPDLATVSKLPGRTKSAQRARSGLI